MSKITTRYYQVVYENNHHRSFSDALRDISIIQPISSRERSIESGRYRLERFDNSTTGIIKGEMIKIQGDNLPAEVLSNSLAELEVEQIGYGIAFIFDIDLSVISVQYDNRVVSPSKFSSYLQLMDSRNRFYFRVIPGPNAWSKFANGEIKNFKLKVALPNSFDSGINNDPMGSSISQIAKAYSSPYVTIEVGVGRKKTAILNSIINTASHLLNTTAIESMKAKLVDEVEEIDLLEEMLRDKSDIDIPSEPDESYRIRSHFVEKCFNERRNYISSYSD